MNGDRYTIGQAARRTGLAVRTIRFYADEDVVREVERSESGYRLYDVAGLQRLELLRTLRELGFDLVAIRRLLEREVTVAEVAAAHATLLEEQIRTLSLRRSVVRAIAHNARDTKELTLMSKLAQMSDEERQAAIDEFLDHIFDGLDVDPAFAERIRSGRPKLPDDPTPEQVAAWVEFAELVGDEDFRRSQRSLAEQQAGDRAKGRELDPAEGWTAVAERVLEKAGGALTAGVDPASPEARAVVGELVPAFAGTAADPDSPEFRASLAAWIGTGTDPRAERYWQLLAKINGWPEIPAATPAWEWLAAALRAQG